VGIGASCYTISVPNEVLAKMSELRKRDNRFVSRVAYAKLVIDIRG